MTKLNNRTTHSDNWRDDLRCCLKQVGWSTNVAGSSTDDQEFVGPKFHLAVFVEPFLEWILEGRKTVESRFSKRRVAPYGAVQAGDWLVLKRSSGPVVGICRADDILCLELNPERLLHVRSQYSESLCATDDQFWEARLKSRYLTLIHLNEVHQLPPFSCSKRDRRGWALI